MEPTGFPVSVKLLFMMKQVISRRDKFHPHVSHDESSNSFYMKIKYFCDVLLGVSSENKTQSDCPNVNVDFIKLQKASSVFPLLTAVDPPRPQLCLCQLLHPGLWPPLNLPGYFWIIFLRIECMLLLLFWSELVSKLYSKENITVTSTLNHTDAFEFKTEPQRDEWRVLNELDCIQLLAFICYITLCFEKSLWYKQIQTVELKNWRRSVVFYDLHLIFGKR